MRKTTLNEEQRKALTAVLNAIGEAGGPTRYAISKKGKGFDRSRLSRMETGTQFVSDELAGYILGRIRLYAKKSKVAFPEELFKKFEPFMGRKVA